MNITIFHRYGIFLSSLLGVTLAFGTIADANAARLTIADDVVVKFGEDAGLVVRDGIYTGRNTVFTSLADDSHAGQTGTSPAIPAPGNWRGLRIDPTVDAVDLQLRGLVIRYGGAGDAAALDIAAGSHVIEFIDVADSLLGIRTSEASAVHFNGISLNRNTVGLESRDSSTPTIAGSDISQNTNLGVLNLTPEHVVQAPGNWWGSASGPTAEDNPGGDGDAVSSGVNVGQFVTMIPLLDCSIRVADGNYNIALPSTTVALACRNAVEVRLAPTDQFEGIPFAPMASTAVFPLTLPVGQKQIHAQFRATTGNTQTVSLPKTIQYNPGAPSVAIQTPAPDAEVTADTLIIASATHPLGIAKVQFFIGNQPIGVVTQPPYEVLWKISEFAVGDYTLRAVATATSSQTAQTQQVVKLRPGNIDPAAPVVGDVRFNNQLVLDGETLTEPGALSFSATAPSGVVTTSLQVDGMPIGGGQFAQHRYSVWLDFAAITNGPHLFRLGAVNGFGAAEHSDLNLIVDLAPPPAPVLLAPADGSVVAQSQVAVSGSAQAGSQVRLLVEEVAASGWIAVAPSGAFAKSLTLVDEGTHVITAEARNARGTGPRSTGTFVTLMPSDPQVTLLQPSANAVLAVDSQIDVAIVDATGLDRVEYLVDGAPAHTVQTPPYGWLWPVSAATDGSHTLTARAINTAGRSGEASVNIVVKKTQPPVPPVPTPYTGEILSVAPASSYGPQAITIKGRALERGSNAVVPHALLQLALDANGYQRRINVASDAAGAFSFVFQPASSDAGLHRIAAVHPDETVADWPQSFTIDRLKLSPTQYSLHAARTVLKTVRITVSASSGGGASGVRLEATPSEQPSGQLPAGVQVLVPQSIIVAPGGSRTIDVGILASNVAPQTGTLVLALYAANSGNTVRGRVNIPFVLSQPQPALVPKPIALQIGLSQGQQSSGTVQLFNQGLIAANGVAAQLVDGAGTGPAPAWMHLTTPAQIGTIEVGASQPLGLMFSPDANVSDGVHHARLRISADNAVGGDISVAVNVTQSGIGHVQFHAADIFTATLDDEGQPIPGLAGARIRLQHETVPGLGGEVTTNAEGLATFADLPAGHYTWRASASDHSDASGHVQILPGITTTQDVFLAFETISIEWDVTETTIDDEYDVVIAATYQTNVPAPVVLIEPPFINLPALQQGEEWSGQITISNYGLVQAQHLVFHPASDDASFEYTFIGDVPATLPARERITLGVKVTALQPLLAGKQIALNGMASGASLMSPLLADAKSGGTCHSYRSGMSVTFDYQCANGTTQAGGSNASFGRTWGSQCGGGGSAGGSGGGGVGGWGGGGSGGPAGTSLSDAPGCTPNCKKCCTKGGGSGD